MRRASASPAAWARASRAMRSSVALVATTASVVLRPFPTAPNGAPPRAKCDIVVGALVVLNAVGNILDGAGAGLAGARAAAPAPSRMVPNAYRTNRAAPA